MMKKPRSARDNQTLVDGAATAADAGSRLTQAFLQDLIADWEAHGGAAIATVRTDRPHDYLKLVTSLSPKEPNAKVNELDALTDEELAQRLADVLARLAAAGAEPGPGDGTAAPA